MRLVYIPPVPTEYEFQQYRNGPIYSRSLFDENVKNMTAQVVQQRRQHLLNKRFMERWDREYEARRYIELKRDLFFVLSQALPPLTPPHP